MSKKILVTGASGFTGKALCSRLIKEGEEVIAFVRSTSKTQVLEALGVEIRTVDIKNYTEVAENFADVDKVYHLAAAWRTEHSDQDEFRLVNVEATRNLLEASKKVGLSRFIHCSTVGVQGHIDEPPANEDYRYNPGDHYQRTKLEGEILVRKYISHGLPGVVVRPAGIYGPGDTRFLKLFRPISKGFFIMIGPGKTFYHFTYVDDLVEGFLLAGSMKQALGEVFTIAGGQYVSLRELINLIADVLDKPHPRGRIPYFPVYAAAVICDMICRPFKIPPPLYPRRVQFFIKDRAFSIAKAQNILGFRPRISLKDGLKKTAEWYHQQDLI